MEVSCSSASTYSYTPLAIHSSINLLHNHHPLSFHRYSPNKPLSLHPLRASSSSVFGFALSQSKTPSSSYRSVIRKPRRVSALFERFTERAIKAVVFSQREARELGKQMVFTQHLLLGLVAEDRDPKGFLGSGITIQEAREAVHTIWNDVTEEEASSSVSSITSATDIPFSVSTKRVFDAAHEYSRNKGYNFIAPEHIAIGLFTVDDGSAAQVFKRLGANLNQLASVAVSRLQGELAKDGRKPSASSKEVQKNSGKATAVKSSGNKKGEHQGPNTNYVFI